MNKYQVIGAPWQVAATDFDCNLTLARKMCKTALFSNQRAALVVGEFRRKRDAEMFRQRCALELAFKSGRLGRWLPSTFVVMDL